MKKRSKTKSYYPWTGTFQTLEEVDAYFDRDEIECLICGKLCRSLHNHIRLAHEVSPDDYRESFGIPWTRGLVSRSMKENLAAVMNRQRKEGILPQSPSLSHLKKLRKAAINRRQPVAAVRDGMRRHALNVHGREEKWGIKDFEEYLHRIKSGRTLSEVGKDDDMPCREVFDKYLRNNAEFRKKFEKAWDALPFAVQIRGQRTGLRFKKEVERLRAKNLSWPEIGRRLGVKTGTARGTWFRKAQ